MQLPVLNEGLVPSLADWDDWRWQVKNMLTREAQFGARVQLTEDERAGFAAAPGLFRVGATPYYASLMDPAHASCPIRRQAIPSARELATTTGESRDPLGEDKNSPAPTIFHKYPDRVLLMVADRCAIYCRHCNRRRIVGGETPPTKTDIAAGIEYIRRTPAVRDVLLSGGDPLLLSTSRLETILAELSAIPHVDFIRIGTRVPVVLPMRIDDELCTMLRRYAPLYINTHFNHPKELTARAREGCERLVDSGIPVGNQAVLLRGINSSTPCLDRLFRELVKIRVRPYYLFQGDTVWGTDHLRTRVETAIELMRGLRGWSSGMTIPHMVIDAPGGGGKIPIGPDYLQSVDDEKAVLTNYRGQRVVYPQPAEADPTVPYDAVYFGQSATATQ